jgi:squalene monooxygenase
MNGTKTKTKTATASAIEDARVRREEYHEADIVVVGAGIFGCAAAYAFANQGRSVLLLERRMKEPDRIVGELLQPGGLAALRKLGLGDCVNGIDAIPCLGYNVIYNGEERVISYPALNEAGIVEHQWHGAGTEGKREQGRGFHHGRFIMQLRRACLAHENITVVETDVDSTIRGETTDQILGVESRTPDPQTGGKRKDYFFGDLTIIADGYASKFRKQVLKTVPVSRSKFYALELIDCVLPSPGYGHVVMGKTTPILLYQIGTHETRALFDVPLDLPEASAAAGGVRNYLKNHAVPSLPASVQASALRALEDGKIPRSMPNSWLPPARQVPNGAVVLGDAMNMRHPLTGGGMTVAFNDVVTLSELLHPSRVPSLQDNRAVQGAMEEMHWRRKSYTAIINVLAQALYSLFAANDPQLFSLRDGCFEYFRRGMTDGPVGMLGGIIHRPVILAYHFFSVAFLAIWMSMCSTIGSPLGLWKLPLALIDSVLILWKACDVFLPVIWREGFR